MLNTVPGCGGGYGCSCGYGCRCKLLLRLWLPLQLRSVNLSYTYPDQDMAMRADMALRDRIASSIADLYSPYV